MSDDLESKGAKIEWTANGSPRLIQGDNLSAIAGKGNTSAPSVPKAISMVDELSKLYGIQNAAAEYVNKGAATADLNEDELGFKMVKLQQMYQGMRVVGGELIVHFSPDGHCYEITGDYVKTQSVNPNAVKTKAEAAAHAKKIFKNRTKSKGEVSGEPTLVIYDDYGSKDPEVAYELIVGAGDLKAWKFYVSAKTGRILGSETLVMEIAPGSGAYLTTQTGRVLTTEGGGSVSVQGLRDGSNFFLYNNSDRWRVYDLSTRTYSYRSTSLISPSPDWGSTDRFAISTAYNLSKVTEYFNTIHSRWGMNGSGIYSTGKIRLNDFNAYYNHRDKEMKFGAGNGRSAGPLAVLDVVAHEWAHGLVAFTAALPYQGETGALNESFADIFGAAVEFYTQPNGTSQYPDSTPGYADWLLGEDVYIGSRTFRDLRNPGRLRYPSKYRGTNWRNTARGAADHGGVHSNSSVMNHFFYLLSEGGSGSNDGITYSGLVGLGITNASRIAYRALTRYCSSRTDYSRVRDAWISAARDLNSSWVDDVENAWRAVGIGGSSGSDDHGDRFSDATVIEPGSSIGGNLEEPGDWDYFSITVPTSGDLTIYSTGRTDTYVYLFAYDGSYIGKNDDSGAGRNFRLKKTVSAGTYRVRVRGYSSTRTTGPYRFNVTFRSSYLIPEIQITGLRNYIIQDGDLTPTNLNGTHFGSVHHRVGRVDHVFRIRNLGRANLYLHETPASRIWRSGTGAGHFQEPVYPARYVRPGRSTAFKLRFDPYSPGIHSASISVANTDLDESDYNFDVKGVGAGVVDDHSDYYSSATSVSSVSTTDGYLDTHDHDYFRVSVSSNGYLSTSTTGTTNTYGRLYQQYYSRGAYRARLLTQNDNRGIGNNFQINRYVTAGTYFIRVSGKSRTRDRGDYQLSVAFSTEGFGPEIRVIGNGYEITDSDYSSRSLDGTHFGSIDVNTGSLYRDFYVQNLGTENLRLSSYYLSGNSNFRIRTNPARTLRPRRASRMRVQYTPTSSGNHSATVNLFNNDVNEGLYQFGISGIGTGQVDDHGNTRRTASLITLNSTVAGEFETTGDSDYYKVYIPQSGTLTVSSGGSLDTYGYLYKGSVLRGRDDDSGSGWNFRIARNVTTGYHYIRVRPYYSRSTGTYTVTTSFTPYVGAPEVSITGNGYTISRGDSSPSTVDHTDFGSQDYTGGYIDRTYSILNTGSQSLRMTGRPTIQITGSNSSQFSVVYNPVTTLRAGYYTTFRIRYDPSIAGTHFAQIVVYNNDSDENYYNFSIRGTATGVSDDHGDSISSASYVSYGSYISGNLERSYDNDYFSFYVSTTSTVNVYTTGSTDTYGYLYNSSGTQLNSNDDGGGGFGLNTYMSTRLTPGWYRVRIRGYGYSATGSYNLIVN